MERAITGLAVDQDDKDDETRILSVATEVVGEPEEDVEMKTSQK